jgi:cobalt-precorrin 5A hydrolase/precorrin-3B C17-methyltransferase
MTPSASDFIPSATNSVIVSNSLAAERVRQAVGSKIYTFKEAKDVDELFRVFDLIIYVCAAPIAVRAIARARLTKATDPAVVCVDDTLQHSVVLLGAHKGGNQAARYLEKTIGAKAIVTTASDLRYAPSLDEIPGVRASGDLPAIQGRINNRMPLWLEGQRENLPPALREVNFEADPSLGFVLKTEASSNDPTYDSDKKIVHLTKERSVVLGVGCSSSCSKEEMRDAVETAVSQVGLEISDFVAVATIDRRKDHHAVTGLGLPVLAFTSEQLRGVRVPNPSSKVKEEVGTSSVAEAAALLALGPRSRLVLEKIKFEQATVAVAEIAPRGKLRIVGVGPGSPLHRTRRSEIAIANAEIVIGFRGYLELCSDLLTNGQQRIPYEIGEESKRVERAIEEAEMGHDVALICSGDPGVYAMASLVFETRASRDLSSLSYDIEVVPGVTAALAASAAKGAILGHDHAYISLSDLLTPWSKIEQAIRSLAGTHLVVAIYNPRSKGRRWQFQRAISILKEIRGNSTYVLLAKSVTRDSENLTVTTLGDLDENLVDMETVVIVGSTSSSLEGEHIYTPRGYSVDGAC